MLYTLFGFVTVVTFLFFLLAMLMTAMTIFSSYSCSYYEGGLEKKETFINRFEYFFNNKVLLNMIAECGTK